MPKIIIRRTPARRQPPYVHNAVDVFEGCAVSRSELAQFIAEILTEFEKTERTEEPISYVVEKLEGTLRDKLASVSQDSYIRMLSVITVLTTLSDTSVIANILTRNPGGRLYHRAAKELAQKLERIGKDHDTAKTE